MTTKEALQLTSGRNILHSRYGKSRVHEVIGNTEDDFFGVVILPLTTPGKRLLFFESESTVNTFLEDSPRHLKPWEHITGTKKRTKLDLIDLAPGKNVQVSFFRSKTNNPAIPPRPLEAIGALQKHHNGLYVDGGRITFEGELETIFQDYKKGLGWSGYDFTFCKFRFKGEKYVTFILIDLMDTGYIMSIEDGTFSFTANVKDFNKNEKRILRQLTEHIAGLKLPYPAITYQLV